MTSIEYTPTNLGDDQGTLGMPLSTIVGGDTALATRDGDSSYVDLYVTSPTVVTYRDAVTFRLTPTGAGATAPIDRLLLDYEFRMAPATTNGVVSFQLNHYGGLSAFATATDSTGYVYGESVVIADRSTGNALHLAALDDVRTGTGFWYIFPQDPSATRNIQTRVTFLRVRAEYGPAAVPFLRQRNRDTTRARLRASRQRSIRARGYL